MPTIKFTKRSIEAMKPARADIVLRDAELRGFLGKVTPKGRRIYYCYYRTTHSTASDTAARPKSPIRPISLLELGCNSPAIRR
jgi:hypothetical protein